MGLKVHAGPAPNFKLIIADLLSAERDEAKRQGEEVDSSPKPPATEQQIAEAEAARGRHFHGDFRAFLKTCNGWDNVDFGIMLIGTNELCDAGEYEDYRECLSDIYEEKTEGCEVSEEHNQALVIGWSENDASLILLVESGEVVEWMYEEISRHDDLGCYLQGLKSNLLSNRDRALAAIARTKAEWEPENRTRGVRLLVEELSKTKPVTAARQSYDPIPSLPPVAVSDLVLRDSKDNVAAEVGLGLTLYLGASPSKDEVLQCFRSFRKHFPIRRTLSWQEATLHGFSINTEEDPDAEPFADVMHIDDYGYHGLRVSLGSSDKANELYYLNLRGIPPEYVDNKEVPRASFLELFVPHSESPEALYAFALDMLALLPVRSGHGGFVARVSDEDSVAKPWTSVHSWCRRFFGIEALSIDGWLLSARNRLRGVSWITIVGEAFSSVLDANSSLANLSEGIERRDGRYGTLFSVGKEPSLFDLASESFPDALAELSSRLQYLSVSDFLKQGNLSMGGVWFSTSSSELPGAFSDHHATAAYLRRFTDPQSFVGPSAREKAIALIEAAVDQMDADNLKRWHAYNNVSEDEGFGSILRLLYNASWFCKNKALSVEALEYAAGFYDFAPKEVYNNLLNHYVIERCIEQGLELLPIALQAAKENSWIYHGAACLLVLVDRLDEAVEMVVRAKEGAYPHFEKMLSDNDLAAIAEREEFLKLFE